MPWGDEWNQAATVAHAACQPHIRARIRPKDFIPASTRGMSKTADEIEAELLAAWGLK